MKRFLWLLIMVLSISVKASAYVDSFAKNGQVYMITSQESDTFTKNNQTYIVRYVVVPEMADALRTNGKIYIVVLVIATIFAGIFLYLIYLQRKVNRL